MATYYWHNEGRLGNLLFQYAAILKSTSPHDRVYCFENEVFDLLDFDQRFRVIPGAGRVARRVNAEVNRFICWITSIGLIGRVQPESTMQLDVFPTESKDVIRTFGGLKMLFMIKGFFQFGDVRATPLPFKPTILSAAKTRLESQTRATNTVAVHIRETDYHDWTVYGLAGVVIPRLWYHERMSEIRARLDSPVFVIFSDDIASTKRLSLGEDVIYFAGNGPLEDFAAMAVCAHAIISPSSFAWWSTAVFTHPGKIVMAPTHWAGFKSQVWYPPTIVSKGIEYFPVQKEA